MSVAKLAQEILNEESPFFSGAVADFNFDEGINANRNEIDVQTVADEVRTVIQEELGEIRDKLVMENEELKKKNSKLSIIVSTIVKCPPFPKKITKDPTTPKEVLEYSSGHPSYITSWRNNERRGNYNGRIKLHAFISCVKDLVKDEKSLSMEIGEYYRKAFDNIENKIETWMTKAEESEISLSEYINLKVIV